MKVKKRYNQFADLPTLDLKEFEALTDLLYEATNGNISATCRILAIDRRTWDRWIKQPPQWPWWNLILRTAIKHMMIGIKGRRGSPARAHAAYVRDALARIPNSTELLEEIEIQSYQYRECEVHIRNLLSHGPMNWEDIQKAANSGGYSRKQLRTAAKALGVVKDRVPAGDSVWSLPETGED